MTTFLGAPVLVRGEAWGNIYLTEKEGGEFDEADEQALLVLARWVAIAIENAHLYEDIDARRGELERAVSGLEATVTITRAIGGETDIDRVLELVVKRAARWWTPACCSCCSRRATSSSVAAAAGEAGADVVGQPLRAARTALGEILRTGHAERLTDLSSRVRLGLGELADGRRRRPCSCRSPSTAAASASWSRSIASIRLAPFSADDERLMRAFAGSAATALATAQNVEAEQLRMSIAAADQERARWARELHDETLQGLGALQVMLTDGAASRPEALAAAVEQAIEQIETQVHELQGLITELRPAAARRPRACSRAGDACTSASAPRMASTWRARRADLRGRASTRAASSPEIEGTVYRLVQEALTNIAKHANAYRAQARVVERDGEVVDRGRGTRAHGFDPARGDARASGWSACASAWSSPGERSRSSLDPAAAPAYHGHAARRHRPPDGEDAHEADAAAGATAPRRRAPPRDASITRPRRPAVPASGQAEAPAPERLRHELDGDQAEHRPRGEGERERAADPRSPPRAGTPARAPTGCGALVSTAAQNCWRGRESGRLHRDRDAGALGDVLQRDREDHEQAEALRLRRVCRADREPLRQAVHQQHGEDEHRAPHARAPAAAPRGRRAPPGRARDEQERDPDREPGRDAPSEPSSSAGSSSPTIDATVIRPTVRPQSAGPQRVGVRAQARDRQCAEAGGQRRRRCRPARAAPPPCRAYSTGRGRGRSGPARTGWCGPSSAGCARGATRPCARSGTAARRSRCWCGRARSGAGCRPRAR